MSKNTKAKTLRKVRCILFTGMLFHYGSSILKAGKLPFTDVVYDFILTHIYNGFLGVLIRPVCEWFWNCEWYETIYSLSGKPSVLLVILLTCLIRMKENGGKIKEEKYINVFGNLGTYSTPKPSVVFRIKNFFRKHMSGKEVNIVKEAENMVMLRVISGKEERAQNLTYESECTISEKLRAVYDKGTDAIILETGNGTRKTLCKGEKIVSGNLVVHYL